MAPAAEIRKKEVYSFYQPHLVMRAIKTIRHYNSSVDFT